MSNVTTTRSDDDSWDIASSVGATAVMVAAARAAETRSDAPLIRDPFAQLLVERAGAGAWSVIASDDVRRQLAELDPEADRIMQYAVDYQAVRTRFFDGFFERASLAGITQVVILAAGLDSRAYRLDWPAGTTVYEIDQPLVLQYKRQTLDEHDVRSACLRREVAVDLRQDWPVALQREGFDVTVPTAWLAEGLLMYLPTEAQDRLFELIVDQSAPGSRIAVEAVGPDNAKRHEVRSKMREHFDRARKLAGIEGESLDVGSLMYHDENRTDVPQWLAGRGWTVRAIPAEAEMADAGRLVHSEEDIRGNTLIEAELKG
ncbi:SAM-dependent methyltransferase [Mycobacteroides chelonae]|uniref:S-adenosyl-L-methionine-dependent methyltransferase n=1 Tax=Mycobacteroides chelonae TaxID=1774 RepID=A0A1S1KSL1_MYCCH|nr:MULTISPECIES: SAM-dependent methyltransferase [Mycobacteroides]AYM44147.1 SAM-dependent methyltransferase [[Mycobacterium] chelonae subsp. gwanakae]KRQ19108.1 SAM-dependent methyltransferase [Mycobacteroides sp. H003]KRQ32820.1 SAM-dependent methyltransferase [Mycobacteroides sp. H092]KRQ43289.1 SAM-dependent methyltransferase [Mycobacteroides sp. H063]KRQ44641.1 SAM-dependent methyltransferase [Mycobacteroides sp. H101]